MENVTGFGSELRVVASNTFPTGFSITQFTGDSDPLDIPSIQLSDKEMGVNGDMIVWSKPSPLIVTINVIPNSDDDINLSILAESNRIGQGKPSVRDEITLVGIYPDGRTLTLQNGVITDATPATGIASSGRMKTKTYMFAFQGKTGI